MRQPLPQFREQNGSVSSAEERACPRALPGHRKTVDSDRIHVDGETRPSMQVVQHVRIQRESGRPEIAVGSRDRHTPPCSRLVQEFQTMPPGRAVEATGKNNVDVTMKGGDVPDDRW